MLAFGGTARRYCDGVRRRDVLVAGALGLGGFTLAHLLRAEAAAAPTTRRPKSVIYVVLGGGPSHIDMWDLKPDAPAEIRGPFRPIATNVPGIAICEHMPRQAAMFDQFALVRAGRWPAVRGRRRKSARPSISAASRRKPSPATAAASMPTSPQATSRSSNGINP